MGGNNLKAFTAIASELQEVDAYLEQCFEESSGLVKEGFKYMLQAGGKRLRPAFVILGSRYGSSRGWLRAACAMELVHMVSLVHDDVIDASDLRRGQDTLRKRYGDFAAVHLGDFMFAKSLALLESYCIDELNKKLAAASFGMCRAEIAQLVGERNYRQGLKEYLARIKKKTARLMSVSLQAGAIVAGAPQEAIDRLGRFGIYLGMAFQIADDLQDYTADEKTLGKPVGADMKQGLLTLPLLYLHKTAPPEIWREAETLLQEEALSPVQGEFIRKAAAASGALAKTRDTANRYVGKALRQLEFLPEVPATEILRNLAASYYQY